MKFFKNSWKQIKTIFKQGLSPRELSLCISIAFLATTFPIYGLTILAFTYLAFRFKLNLPLMIALNVLFEPLRILLFVPFVKIGHHIFGANHSLSSFAEIKESFHHNFWMTFKELSYEVAFGLLGWSLVAIPSSIVLFFLLKQILSYKEKRQERPQGNYEF